MNKHILRVSSHTLALLFFLAILCTALLSYYALDYSLLIPFHETFFYRYSSSLIWLFGNDHSAKLFAPQGQLLGVIQNAINLSLSLLGWPAFSESHFFERSKLFGFISTLTYSIFLIGALISILKYAKTYSASALICIVSLALFFGSGPFGVMEFIKPDYEPYILLVFIFSSAFTIHITNQNLVVWRDSMILGALGAASVATKLTLFIIPASLVMLLFLFASRLSTAAAIIWRSIIIGGLLCLIIWYLQYLSIGTAYEALLYSQNLSKIYYSNSNISQNVAYFLDKFFMWDDPMSIIERIYFFSCIPVIITLFTIKSGNKKYIFLALTFLFIAIYFYAYYARRMVASTWFEVLSFQVYVLITTILIFDQNGLFRIINKKVDFFLSISLFLIFGFLFTFNIYRYMLSDYRDAGYVNYKYTTEFSKNSWDIFSSIQGKQLFLFNSDWTPLKIENAMYGISKNITHHSGNSHRDFISNINTERHFNSAEYSSIIFYMELDSQLNTSLEVEKQWNTLSNKFLNVDLKEFKKQKVYIAGKTPYDYSKVGAYVVYSK